MCAFFDGPVPLPRRGGVPSHPAGLRKLGFDPATASSIFLTTATDVVSMGTFLGLATLLIK